MSNVPPAVRRRSKRSRQGQLAKLGRPYKVQRLARRKSKGTWPVRVWANRHIKEKG